MLCANLKQSKTMLVKLLVALAVLLLAGCGSDSVDDKQPSQEPAVPTESPSVSVEPSVAPSIQPPVIVTAPPTRPPVWPSSLPTYEPWPTFPPGVEPSKRPSGEPSPVPTTVPSVGPSSELTPEPSVEPSLGLTPEPSVEPSLDPTVDPSLEPSLAPSVDPSLVPTVSPSTTPSDEPSLEPSSEPASSIEVRLDTPVENISDSEITLTGTLVKTVQSAIQPRALARSRMASASSNETALALGSVKALHGRIAGVPINGSIDGERWTVTVPLLEGNNQLQLILTDSNGFEHAQYFNIGRTLDNAPLLVSFTGPNQGELLTQANPVVRGRIVLKQPSNSLSVALDGKPVQQLQQVKANEYEFVTHALDLISGLNISALIVTTDQDELVEKLYLFYQPEQIDSLGPQVVILAPEEFEQLSDASFMLVADIIAEAGIKQLSLDGQSVGNYITGMNYYQLRAIKQFAEGSNVATADIKVVDLNDREYTKSVQWQRDTVSPIIELANSVLAYPALNTVIEQSINLQGEVIDANLASLLINGQSVSLSPAGIGRYQFNHELQLIPGEERIVNLEAYDQAGNKGYLALRYLLDSSYLLNLVQPAAGSKIILGSGPLMVSGTLSQLPESGSIRFSLRQGAKQVAQAQHALSSAFFSFPLTLDNSVGDMALDVVLLDANGNEVAKQTRQLTIVDPANIELAMISSQPEMNSQDAAPNGFLALHFNKAVELAQLDLKVFETASGLTYQDMDQPGADSFNGQGHQLVNVARANELVAGTVSLLPGNKSLTFYPARPFAYNARVTVALSYAGEPLANYGFQTRLLPTIVTGNVLDINGSPIVGAMVDIPALNKTAQTNQDGAYQFRFTAGEEREISSGNYLIRFNPNMHQASYSSTESRERISQGRFNQISVKRLAPISDQSGFTALQANQVNSLMNGALKLDFQAASFTLPETSLATMVQGQFLEYHQLTVQLNPAAMPLWSYAVHPAGILVDGQLNVDFALPRLNGGYEYLPEDNTYVLLLGASADGATLTPVGAGQIKQHRVVSVGNTEFKRLDYIAYASVDPSHQPLFEKYISEQWNVAKLMQALTLAASSK